MFLCYWKDKKVVRCLNSNLIYSEKTTFCQRGDRNVEGGITNVRRPIVIEHYNKKMGGVDRRLIYIH